MFIVNQNETEIVNVDNLIEIQLDDKVIYGVCAIGKIPLGKYDSSYEARKEFDSIRYVIAREKSIKLT